MKYEIDPLRCGKCFVQYVADRFSYHQFRPPVRACLGTVDENEVLPVEIIDQSCRRINDEGSAADDERVGSADCRNRTLDRIIVETFLIEDNIRTDNPAAVRAMRYRTVMQNKVEFIMRAAAHAVRTANGSVQLIDRL